MNSITGPIAGRARSGFRFARGTASANASRTIRRCTPSFRATPFTVPTPCSYSRRIASNNSTVALFLPIRPPPASSRCLA